MHKHSKHNTGWNAQAPRVVIKMLSPGVSVDKHDRLGLARYERKVGNRLEVMWANFEIKRHRSLFA